jgi:hypothetical protein
MRTTFTAPLTALALATTMAAGLSVPASYAAPPPAAGAAQPVTVEPLDITAPATGTEGAGIFEGTFTVTDFVVENGQLVANGVVAGEFTDSDTGAVTAVPAEVVGTTVTAAGSGGSCGVLDLDLGPLHLDLLGLVVDLDEVVLDVVAEQGPGNLLGNLLCAVTGLLDGGGPLTGLTALLDRINGLLGR